ncbi:MAG: photosynthetic complex assembly protein PuhC [Alphaproteobacteria bacterium]|nr:photosynthetic complex assembly protein PuhC [Alphaproteobacteria bacterium]
MADAESKHRPHPEDAIPRLAVIGAGLMVAAAILLSYGASSGSLDRFTTQPAAQTVETRTVRFTDAPDGRVLVEDAETGALIHEIAVGEENFIRGVLRGLARERMLNDVGRAPAFELVRWSDGRFTLRDTGTDRLIDLGGFGVDNAAAFARLMTSAGDGR